ncbi:MAG TPA: hypothetical protein DD706_17355 [Nitrospiraceae bacterium]|nr:hypothetical protein [Nitrospiraceae bacterium]
MGVPDMPSSSSIEKRHCVFKILQPAVLMLDPASQSNSSCSSLQKEKLHFTSFRFLHRRTALVLASKDSIG